MQTGYSGNYSQQQLAELAEIFRTDKGPDYELARWYLKVSKGTLENDLHADEGIVGEIVWAAAEALRIRGQATELSKWILSDRKEPCPTATDATNNSETTT